MGLFIYICVYVQLCVLVRSSVFICVCMYVCFCVCVYECMLDFRPVLMVLSTPAPHGPEDAAPQYQHMFVNNTDHRYGVICDSSDQRCGVKL